MPGLGTEGQREQPVCCAWGWFCHNCLRELLLQQRQGSEVLSEKHGREGRGPEIFQSSTPTAARLSEMFSQEQKQKHIFTWSGSGS